MCGLWKISGLSDPQITNMLGLKTRTHGKARMVPSLSTFASYYVWLFQLLKARAFHKYQAACSNDLTYIHTTRSPVERLSWVKTYVHEMRRSQLQESVKH